MDLAGLMGLLALDERFRPGNAIIKMGALVQIVASATSTTLYQLSTGRTAWLLGLMIYNDFTSDVRLSIGTGDFTARLPQIGPILSTWDDIRWLPPTEFTADIVIQSDGASASTDEVEVAAIVAEIR